jgi:hypothetical protein
LRKESQRYEEYRKIEERRDLNIRNMCMSDSEEYCEGKDEKNRERVKEREI